MTLGRMRELATEVETALRITDAAYLRTDALTAAEREMHHARDGLRRALDALHFDLRRMELARVGGAP